jgi:soluble lytic murein transglycosylase-like protein
MVSSAMDAVEDPEDVVSEATVLDEDTWNVRPVDEVVSIEETKAAAEAEEKAEAKAKAAAEAKERKDRIFSYRENYANLYANTYIDKTYVDMAIEECKKYGVSPYLIVAQIEAESSGQPDAVSCANAVGLMQIIEKWNYDTMEEFGVTDLTDPKGNIQVGVKIMSCLLSKYDTKTALMCYNEGEYGTARKRAAEGNYSAYAKKITARAEELKK